MVIMKGFFDAKNEKIHYAVIAVAVICSSLFMWGATYSDSVTFAKTTNYLFGYEDAFRFEHRMIRPVTMFMAGPLVPLLGIINSFAAINVLFGVLASVMLYMFALRFYRRPKIAFYSALFFATSIPAFVFGSALLTEMPAFFATILAIYLVFRMKASHTHKQMAAYALLLAFSMLIRETSIFIVPIYFLISKYSEKKVLAKGMLTIIMALALTGAYYAAYNVNPLNAFKAVEDLGMSYENPTYYSPKVFIMSFMGFAFLPIFAFLGFVLDSDRKRLVNYYAMFAAFLPLLAWPAFDIKITFTVFPLVIPLSALGIEAFAQQMAKKPLFSRLSSRSYELLLILAYIAVGALYSILIMPKYIVPI
jgi:hypothetical protein